MKYVVEIDDPTVFIVQSLRDDLDNLKSKSRIPFFSHDKAEEKAKVKELKAAIKTVLRYYGEEV